MDELEPCPFCGGDVKLIRDPEMEHYVIECKNHAWGDPNETPDMAAGDVSMVSWRDTEESKHALIETWNARWVRTCQMLNDDWDDSFGEYKHLYECGICSESTALLCCINENGDTEWVKPKFCGNCGAKVVER